MDSTTSVHRRVSPADARLAGMMEALMSQLSPAMAQRVRDAECAWNTRDCDALVLTNAIDCHWRNRVYFLWGREQIRTYIERQLRREIDQRVIFEPWTEGDRRLAYRFAAEFRTDSGSCRIAPWRARSSAVTGLPAAARSAAMSPAIAPA